MKIKRNFDASTILDQNQLMEDFFPILFFAISQYISRYFSVYLRLFQIFYNFPFRIFTISHKKKENLINFFYY